MKIPTAPAGLRLPARIVLSVVGATLVSPLQFWITSTLMKTAWLAALAGLDIIGIVALALGLGSGSRAAIMALLLGGIYFVQAGRPEVGEWASLFAAMKAPIYLIAGLIGLRQEQQQAVRVAGVVFPALGVAYIAWVFIRNN